MDQQLFTSTEPTGNSEMVKKDDTQYEEYNKQEEVAVVAETDWAMSADISFIVRKDVPQFQIQGQ